MWDGSLLMEKCYVRWVTSHGEVSCQPRTYRWRSDHLPYNFLAGSALEDVRAAVHPTSARSWPSSGWSGILVGLGGIRNCSWSVSSRAVNARETHVITSEWLRSSGGKPQCRVNVPYASKCAFRLHSLVLLWSGPEWHSQPLCLRLGTCSPRRCIQGRAAPRRLRWLPAVRRDSQCLRQRRRRLRCILRWVGRSIIPTRGGLLQKCCDFRVARSLRKTIALQGVQEFYRACTIGGILSCGLTHTAGKPHNIEMASDTAAAALHDRWDQPRCVANVFVCFDMQ